MKRVNSIKQACVIGAVAMSVSGAWSQDWPQWRGPDRDGKASGFSAPKTWPKTLLQRWKTSVGSGDATPALVGDKLYVFSRQDTNEVVRCLNAITGKEIWQEKYEAPVVDGPDIGHGGPRSSPAVAGGKVLTLGVCGTVSCFDAATGKRLWRKDEFPGAWPQFHTAMSPIIVDRLAIVHLGKESDGALVAYDCATGNLVWKWAGEGPGYSSPVLLTVGSTKMIVTQSAKRMIGIGVADGKLLWQAPSAVQGMSYHAATPIVDGQTVFYGGPGRGIKAVKLEPNGDSFVGKELWSNPDNSVQFSSPVLKSGLVFGLSQRGRFFCINARTGATAWSETTGGRGDFGSIIDAGPVMLALTATSQLFIFQPGAQQYTELASIKVGDTQAYAHPVISGNRLFVKDLNSVTLWMIE